MTSILCHSHAFPHHHTARFSPPPIYAWIKHHVGPCLPTAIILVCFLNVVLNDRCCCVVNPGHCPGEAEGGLPYERWLQPAWRSSLCLPQPHLSNLGCPLWRRRQTFPPPHRKEGRWPSGDVGGKSSSWGFRPPLSAMAFINIYVCFLQIKNLSLSPTVYLLLSSSLSEVKRALKRSQITSYRPLLANGWKCNNTDWTVAPADANNSHNFTVDMSEVNRHWTLTGTFLFHFWVTWYDIWVDHNSWHLKFWLKIASYPAETS